VSRPAFPSDVRIVEVGPRDGLQNEAATVPTDAKIAFTQALADAGLRAVEVTAFVNPKWMPQMADAEAVYRGVARRPGTRYPVLVPNVAGLERALGVDVDEVSIFAAASETFSRRNINQSIEDSLDRYADVARRAAIAKVRVRAYLSTAFGCPYEGAVPVTRVVDLAARLLELGAYEVAISDTIGIAHPGQVWDVLEALFAAVPRERLALHFHDTRGTALSNVLAALQAGVTTFDSSAGGLGGCPYAPGASGNLATEDLLYMLEGLGIETGVSLDAVAAAARGIQPFIGHPLPSRFQQGTMRQRRGP
jgi:isopropylmalate/homocitrate/citramalate synthase